MPVIGAINTCTNGTPPIRDVSRPNDVVVNRAEWGEVVAAQTGTRACDPLVLEVAGLQAGNQLLFINCDDPKVKRLVKGGHISDLPPDAVKPYALPDVDLQGLQNLELSDKAATDLGLNRGCEFAVLQKDSAGNISTKATFVELNNRGDSVAMWARPAGTHIGDAVINTPNYNYNDRGYTRTSSNYNFNRGRDATAATTYLDDIKLFLDAKTGKVTLDADHAVTGKTTVRLKNLTTQETFEAKDEEGDGNIHLDGINLNPGDRYTIWTTDRNGVEERVVDAQFMPASCGATNALNLQCANKTSDD